MAEHKEGTDGWWAVRRAAWEDRVAYARELVTSKQRAQGLVQSIPDDGSWEYRKLVKRADVDARVAGEVLKMAEDGLAGIKPGVQEGTPVP